MTSRSGERAAHWEQVYSDGDTGRSWYQSRAEASMDLIGRAHGAKAGVIDVGGGASTLVDDLLRAGWTDLTVLDIAESGLQIARQRMADRAAEVTWIAADLLEWAPSRHYAVWHDRAVLHFLTGSQLERYRQVQLSATRPGSAVVLGVFGPGGPSRCSGLPVQRYDAEALISFLGPGFDLVDQERQLHRTPAGGTQEFQWISAVRTA